MGGPRLTVGAASSSIRPQVDALFSSRSEITPAKIPPATQRGEARSGPGPQGKSPSRGRRGYKTEAIRESYPPPCPWPRLRPRSPLAGGRPSEQAPCGCGQTGATRGHLPGRQKASLGSGSRLAAKPLHRDGTNTPAAAYLEEGPCSPGSTTPGSESDAGQGTVPQREGHTSTRVMRRFGEHTFLPTVSQLGENTGPDVHLPPPKFAAKDKRAGGTHQRSRPHQTGWRAPRLVGRPGDLRK